VAHVAEAVRGRAFREPGIELIERVHAIGPSRRGLSQGGYSRAYLFEDKDGLTLIDTLWDDDAHVILKYLWSIGRTASDVTRIAITHAHRSHLGGLATMQALSGATVYSHPEEALIIDGRRRAGKIPLTPLRPFVLLPFRIASQLGIQPHVPCEVGELVAENSENNTVGSLKVLDLPGHTRGNLGFYWEEERVLAAADTIMTWPSFSAGWPGFNWDEDEFRRSLERVVALEPKVLCTGHGDPIWPDAPRRIATLVG
jgi:glyoxylase-like metal-dependent hydrolase (beta-lactamase superfamily II)